MPKQFVRDLNTRDRAAFYDQLIEEIKLTLYPVKYEYDKREAIKCLEERKQAVIEGRV